MTGMKGKSKDRRKVSVRCRLLPLVPAVASRMNDPLHHWIGHRTLFLPLLPLSLSFLKAQGLPGSVEFLSNYTCSTVTARTDSCIVPLQGKQKVVHNN